MSRRLQIKNFQVMTASDSTLNPASVTTDVSQVDSIVYRVTVGASVNALLSVTVSNNRDQSSAFTLNFGSTLPLIGGTDTEYLVAIENKGFQWMRLSVANNGGTGTISAFISGTTVGA